MLMQATLIYMSYMTFDCTAFLFYICSFLLLLRVIWVNGSPFLFVTSVIFVEQGICDEKDAYCAAIQARAYF